MGRHKYSYYGNVTYRSVLSNVVLNNKEHKAVVQFSAEEPSVEAKTITTLATLPTGKVASVLYVSYWVICKPMSDFWFVWVGFGIVVRIGWLGSRYQGPPNDNSRAVQNYPRGGSSRGPQSCLM